MFFSAVAVYDASALSRFGMPGFGRFDTTFLGLSTFAMLPIYPLRMLMWYTLACTVAETSFVATISILGGGVAHIACGFIGALWVLCAWKIVVPYLNPIMFLKNRIKVGICTYMECYRKRSLCLLDVYDLLCLARWKFGLGWTREKLPSVCLFNQATSECNITSWCCYRFEKCTRIFTQ